MELIEIFTIVSFLTLLFASIYMLLSFYVCDKQTCKAFNQAADYGEKGSTAYVIALLGELYNDGIWPFPYIGAAVLTVFSLWFVGAALTVKNFAIMFFISFITIYFLFSFFGHHYVRFIAQYTTDYIRNNCPDTSARRLPTYNEDELVDLPSNEDNNQICDGEDIDIKEKPGFESFADGLGITFAAPVNIF